MNAYAAPRPAIAPGDLRHVLDHTRPLWEELRRQRLFLTGGTGFFGCWLLETFLDARDALGLDAQATVLSRDPAAFHRRHPRLAGHPAVTMLAGDTATFQFPDLEFSHVIHAATDVASVHPDGHPLARFRGIQQGTARTLEFAASHGTRRFLLTSSGSVYGRQPDAMTHIPEDYAGAPDPLAPASAYAEGKRASELMCALYAERTGMEIKIARCFAFAGPYLALDAGFAIGNFIRDILERRPITITGDGAPTRSYLYAADLAIWLWTMLFRAPSLSAFNVGSEHEISIAALAHRVVATLRPGTPIEIVKAPARLTASPHRYVPSTAKAQRLLGLRQTIALEETIRRMAAWYGYEA